jgi:hypothetical protein
VTGKKLYEVVHYSYTSLYVVSSNQGVMGGALQINIHKVLVWKTEKSTSGPGH